MARNKSGGFNKLLNFIGLVDDEDTQDTYGEEYSGDNYGRRAAYTPARQQRSTGASGGRATTNRSNTQRRLPESTSRSSRYDSRAARGYDDYRAGERRTASRFDDSGYTAPPPPPPPAARPASPPATASSPIPATTAAGTCPSGSVPSGPCGSASAPAR